MNKKWKQFCARMALAITLALALSFQSLAANARIAFSDPSAETGSEFSVTMKFTSTSGDLLGNTDVMLAYDATAIEFLGGSDNASGGSGAIRVTSGMSGTTEVATTLRFRALKAGTTQITISSWEGYDADGQTLTMDKEGTSTINIAAGAEAQALSSDAALQSLQISPGTLEPAFSPDVDAYTTSVGLDVAKLTVSAVASHEAATVAVEGGADLQPGANTVVCRVTAQDGSTVRNYTITVNKVEGGAAEGTGEVSGETASSAEVLVWLEAAKTPIKIGVQEIPADAEIPAGLKQSTITIGDVRVQGWTPDAEGQDPEYCIFYGINEDGQTGFYRYDRNEKSLQRYFEYDSRNSDDPELLGVVEQYNKLVDDYSLMKWIAIGAAAAALILLVILITMMAKSGSHSSAPQRSYPEPKEPEKRPVKVSRASGGRKLTREERYMMGEEDEYEEEKDDLDYFPQMATAAARVSGEPEPEAYIPEEDPEQFEAETEGYLTQEEEIKKSLAASLKKDDFDEMDLGADDEDDDFEVLDLD